MSSFYVNFLPSSQEDSKPSFLREAENGTTAAIRHNTLLEFGLLAKGARIINNDSAANLIVRLHSRQGTSLIIPPSSEMPLQEWFSEIQFKPNPETGNFHLT